MASNTSITLATLDFDTLKSNLVSFLQSQPQFADYNFSGSNLSVLLDVLSYNTYLNAFYLNMAISESFLDSAQLLSSVISKAKELNYVPRSYRSSQAFLTCVFPQSNLSVLKLPRGTRFAGKNQNGTFQYVTEEALVQYPAGGVFTFANLQVFEGKYVTDAYVVDSTIQNQQFILSNQNVDTNSITVNVVANSGSSNVLYTPASSLFGVSNTSPVYFLQATANGYYQLQFGDGVFGLAPTNGSTIIANYVITSGTDGNEASNFTLVDNIGVINGYGGAIIPTISANNSFGGANSETIESIRFNAPRSFQTQERAVTVNDFQQLVLANFPDVRACYAYGGETTNTVSFGTVFVSAISNAGYNLSNGEKNDIEAFLLDRVTLGITPKMIDPEYIYLDLNVNVEYDPNQTSYTSVDIQNLTSNTIVAYNSSSLEDFNTEFKYSQLTQAINNEDPCISSCEMSVVMKQSVSPSLNTSQTLSVSFQNPLKPGSILSSQFTSNGQIYSFTDYNPNNNTFQFEQSTSGLSIINTSNKLYLQNITVANQQSYAAIGTVNYENGQISIGNITINDFMGGAGVVFYASPVNENIFVTGNTILEIDIETGLTISTSTV